MIRNAVNRLAERVEAVLENIPGSVLGIGDRGGAVVGTVRLAESSDPGIALFIDLALMSWRADSDLVQWEVWQIAESTYLYFRHRYANAVFPDDDTSAAQEWARSAILGAVGGLREIDIQVYGTPFPPYRQGAGDGLAQSLGIDSFRVLAALRSDSAVWQIVRSSTTEVQPSLLRDIGSRFARETSPRQRALVVNLVRETMRSAKASGAATARERSLIAGLLRYSVLRSQLREDDRWGPLEQLYVNLTQEAFL